MCWATSCRTAPRPTSAPSRIRRGCSQRTTPQASGSSWARRSPAPRRRSRSRPTRTSPQSTCRRRFRKWWTRPRFSAAAPGRRSALPIRPPPRRRPRSGRCKSTASLSIIAAGTSDVITGTLTSSLTTLADGQRLTVEATAANGTTAPTFTLTYSVGPTATAAKTIKKGNAQPLARGGHPGRRVQDGSAVQPALRLLAAAQPGLPGRPERRLCSKPDSLQNVGIRSRLAPAPSRRR
jgi:hypothetical protein